MDSEPSSGGVGGGTPDLTYCDPQLEMEEDRAKKRIESPPKDSKSPVGVPPSSKRISFSISSILENSDGGKSPTESHEGGTPLESDIAKTASVSEPGPFKFYYRDRLFPEKTQTSTGEHAAADAVISSWTVPPTSPFIYRECSHRMTSSETVGLGQKFVFGTVKRKYSSSSCIEFRHWFINFYRP